MFAHTRLFAALMAVSLAACAHGPQTDFDDVGLRDKGASDPSTVDVGDIDGRSRNEPIEQILEGRIAGVTVTQGANGIAVRIRGTTSIRGSNEPLYLVDGVPVEPGPGGALAGIMVTEIESIKVLKDAASTAFYGVRGANGVIVVTLKKPGSF